MAVFRLECTRDYTVMSNHHLRDKRLSLKAKGCHGDVQLPTVLPKMQNRSQGRYFTTENDSKQMSRT